MSCRSPHFILSAESSRDQDRANWRFELRTGDGRRQVNAVTEDEPTSPPDRLELLAVVRGLESLDQPSRVTLVTPSRYVNRGLTYGLEEWRDNDWLWEWHGRMIPVRNGDLWRRLDRALQVHTVDRRRAVPCGAAVAQKRAG